MKSRNYPTVEEAYDHLKTLGKLEMHGRGGENYEYMICSLILHDGRKYIIYVYRDGKVILRE